MVDAEGVFHQRIDVAIESIQPLMDAVHLAAQATDLTAEHSRPVETPDFGGICAARVA